MALLSHIQLRTVAMAMRGHRTFSMTDKEIFEMLSTAQGRLAIEAAELSVARALSSLHPDEGLVASKDKQKVRVA